MLGSARQRFLDAAAPRDDDEPVGLAGALQLVLDLLKDPKKAADLAKRALEAQRIIDQAAKVTADLEAAKRKSEDGIAAARAEIERLRADHDAAVTAASREIAAMKNKVAEELVKAETAAKQAAADRAEAKRRLLAVEKAVAGA